MPIDKRKIDHLISSIIEIDNINWFEKLNLDAHIESKLFEYQIYHLYELLIALETSNVIINGSDTGTGKTYVTAALCAKTNLIPIVLCNKTLITYWHEVFKIFEVKPLFIINYEAIIEGKYLNPDDNSKKLIHCPWIKVNEYNNTYERFKWHIPPNAIVIFDEAHKCKNPKSLHGKLLMSIKNIKRKSMLLSATISAVPKDFYIFGYVLGFYDNLKVGKNWINGKIRQDAASLVKVTTNSISSALYPHKGSRMDITELGEVFPRNNIVAIACDLDESLINKFNADFEIIKEGTIEMNKNKNNCNGEHLKRITTARMNLEIYKVDIFVEMAKEYIYEGYNVVIFVNFTKTIKLLASKLKTQNIINGETKLEQRELLIKNFQNNSINLLICNVEIGGESVSLHDIHGKPRVSLISSSFSGIKLKQIFGRIYRANLKTHALQRIIYCANTYEMEIYKKNKEKIAFINMMNDQELESF